jgi:hypothetical protein
MTLIHEKRLENGALGKPEGADRDLVEAGGCEPTGARAVNIDWSDVPGVVAC